MLDVVIALSLIASNLKNPPSSSAAALNRHNTVCGEGFRGILKRDPQKRATFIRDWISQNAKAQSSIRLWYYDKHFKRWRRHQFSSQTLNLLTTRVDRDADVILRENNNEYSLSDFHFYNEINLTPEQEVEHLRDVAHAIRRSFEYPTDPTLKSRRLTEIEITLLRFNDLDPLLVRELIEKDPERANPVIESMVSTARELFSDSADHSFTRVDQQDAAHQVGMQVAARAKFADLYKVTKDERLNPEIVFGAVNPNHNTLAPHGTMTMLESSPRSIYRYRGAEQDTNLPRRPEVLDSSLRRDLKVNDFAKFKTELFENADTIDRLRKLSQRSADLYRDLISWLQNEIREQGAKAGLTQEFVTNLKVLSKRAGEKDLSPELIFPSLYSDGVLKEKLPVGELDPRIVFKNLQRRLLLLDQDRGASVEDYRRVFVSEQNINDLLFLKNHPDPAVYRLAISFLTKHLIERAEVNRSMGIRMREFLKRAANILEERKLEPLNF